MTPYRISVIMPSLNEEKNVEAAVRNVISGYERLGINGEILVVNDGSADSTGRIAEGLGRIYPFVRVLHHEAPQGIGASFRDGVLSALGEVVTMIPGDGENDAFETLRYLPVMDHVDILIPFVYNKDIRSWRRRVLSALYRGIINLSFGMTLNYMNGTVIYRTCILKDVTLKSAGFFYQTELLIKCIRRGYLYAEAPYALNQRTGGVSKATTFRALMRVAGNFFSILADVYARPGKKTIHPDSVTAERWRTLGNGEED